MTSRCSCQIDAHDFGCPIHGDIKCASCWGSGFTADADGIEHNCYDCDSTGRSMLPGPIVVPIAGDRERVKHDHPPDLMGLAMGIPHRKPHSPAPSEADICRLEKAAWDANVEPVLIWYRDQIEQLRERVRETEQALKLEVDRRQAEWRQAAQVVKYFTGQDLDLMEQEYHNGSGPPVGSDPPMTPRTSGPHGKNE